MSVAEKLLDSPESMLFIFLSLVVVAPVLSSAWWKLKVKEWETSLKHVMLERGMSADEIRQVLEATGGRCRAGRSCGFGERSVPGGA